MLENKNLANSRKLMLLLVILSFGLGWSSCLILLKTSPVMASVSESPDGSALISCSISVDYNEGRKVQIPVDGLVYLDYRRGKLVATMPDMRQIGMKTKVLSNFAERDLVEDFQVEPGTTPRFLMSTIAGGALSDGSQMLVVINTQNRQTRVYKLGFLQTGVDFKPTFSLIEKKVFDAKSNTSSNSALGLPQTPNQSATSTQ